MKQEFISSQHPKVETLPLRKHFLNLTLLCLFSIRQQWRMRVGWCSSIQGVLKQASGCLLLLVFVVSFAACEDKDDNKIPEEEPYSLIGTWYMVNSDPKFGYKFIFTETHLTAFRYATDETNRVYLWNNVEYVFINDTTIQVPHLPELIDYPTDGHNMPIVWFNKDLLVLRYASMSEYDSGWNPPSPDALWLHRRDFNVHY